MRYVRAVPGAMVWCHHRHGTLVTTWPDQWQSYWNLMKLLGSIVLLFQEFVSEQCALCTVTWNCRLSVIYLLLVIRREHGTLLTSLGTQSRIHPIPCLVHCIHHHCTTASYVKVKLNGQIINLTFERWLLLAVSIHSNTTLQYWYNICIFRRT